MKVRFYAMFTAVALATTGFLSSPCAMTAGQSSSVQVSIEIKNRLRTFDPGEPVVLLITLQNTIDVTAELSRSCDTLDNVVELSDANGHSPPLTAVGQNFTSVFRMPCPRRALILRPGDRKQIDLDISKLYDLSRPGSYRISISRFVRSPRGTAKSSPLTIRIL
jgi:hypothetical protein